MSPDAQIRSTLAEVDMQVKDAGDLAIQMAASGDPNAVEVEAELDRLIAVRTFIADALRAVEA
jgi:hypothetical protein